jgi:UDP-N-acetylmuramyl pentapeptide phosphotransferase/UDP-N-acetylglucosamine-1-phosphate transferase
MLLILAPAFVAFVVSVALAPMLIEWGRKRRVLDIPNERSSHKAPTPRTGGVGIVAGVVAGVAVCAAFGDGAPDTPQLLLMVALLAGATVGFLDDLMDLPTAVRMLLYLVCAVWLASCGASVHEIEVPGLPPVGIGAIGGLVFSALFIAWWANLFNFMDGIDGIAGGAATVTMGALAFVFLKSGDAFFGSVALAGAAASIGFLAFNFPPARVFMGDVGSVFLGLTAGALSLAAVRQGLLSLPASVLLMFPFAFDATFTLVRRIVMRERFWQAHRSHVYQQMCDLGFSHKAVTLIYTVAALLFALLGLFLSSMPAWGQVLSWWGSLAVALVAAVLVLAKNRG